MSGIEVIREDVEDRVILRLQGTFDGPAAQHLGGLITDLEAAQKVVVDFSRVTDFQDLSVGVLTRALSDRACQLQGLRTHQERMFGYFGIATGGEPRTIGPSEGRLVA